MRSKRPRWALIAMMCIAVGCSGSNSDDGTTIDRDAGTPDSGDDFDAGVRAFCPLAANNPDCNAAGDCEDDRNPQTECTTCPKDNGTLCTLGRCTTPAVIPPANGHVFNVAIAGFENEVDVLVGLAVAAETSGGNAVTCGEVMSGIAWSEWSNPCYNVLRTRYLEIQTVAQVYRLSFSNFASGQKVLFAAYGFANGTTDDPPVGVTCTEFQVGAPGSDFVEIMGDNLIRIQ